MKFLFEINTTFFKPVYLSIDENQSVSALIQQIFITLETNTKLTNTDIVDIFTQDTDEVLSLPESAETIDVFLKNHPQFFSSTNGGLSRNIHKLYVMDSKYLKTINKEVFIKDEIPTNDKTSPIKTIFKTLKTIMPIIYI